MSGSIDPGKEVFEMCRNKSIRTPEDWIKRVEKAVSHVRGEETHFQSVEQTADILVNDLNYFPLEKYQASKISAPPCSITQTANGGPLNCVGRVASLVAISEIKGFLTRSNERVGIEIDVKWTEDENGNRTAEDGHITAYLAGNSKKYLGPQSKYSNPEKYSIDMLPAVYALQNALALGIEGDPRDAKKLTEKGLEMNLKDSAYLNHLGHKIINY